MAMTTIAALRSTTGSSHEGWPEPVIDGAGSEFGLTCEVVVRVDVGVEVGLRIRVGVGSTSWVMMATSSGVLSRVSMLHT